MEEMVRRIVVFTEDKSKMTQAERVFILFRGAWFFFKKAIQVAWEAD